jgi:hypothetical protein
MRAGMRLHPWDRPNAHQDPCRNGTEAIDESIDRRGNLEVSRPAAPPHPPSRRAGELYPEWRDVSIWAENAGGAGTERHSEDYRAM